MLYIRFQDMSQCFEQSMSTERQIPPVQSETCKQNHSNWFNVKWFIVKSLVIQICLTRLMMGEPSVNHDTKYHCE